MEKELAKWICAECAKENNGKPSKLATYNENICDICNRFTSVTELRDWRLSNLKAERNYKYILKQLSDEYIHFVTLTEKSIADTFLYYINKWHKRMMENVK